MDLRSKKRRPVNDRVALFVWVPKRIGSVHRPVNRRTTGVETRASHSIRVAKFSMR